jgi:Tfp pilus assembly protein PilF
MNHADAAPSTDRTDRASGNMRRVAAPTVVAFVAACASTSPQAPQSHATDATEALARGDMERADLDLKLAIQADPLDAQSHHRLACLLAQRGEREQALVGFQRALTIDPADASAAYDAGTLLLQRGDAVAAASLLESAAAIRPNDPRTYNNLAKAYFLAGLPEYAFAAYEETLRHDPTNVVALRGLTTIADAAGIGAAADDYRRRLAATGAPTRVGPVEAAAADPDAPPPTTSPETAPPDGQGGGARDGADPDVDALRPLVRDLPNVKVERRGERVVLVGWTTGPKERELLARVLAGSPDVLDMTTDDTGDPRRMVEVDATLFVVIELDTSSVGFNFLDLVHTSFSYFATDHARNGTGFTAPGSTGVVGSAFQQGWMATASVDYDVNIANAAQDRVAVLARPHLTTLSGTPAKFLSGGEIVYKVSGNISGDIKPYPFGTTLDVTPTVLREPAEDGRPRIHLKVDAGRKSALAALTNVADPSGQTVFDKVEVSSEAVLGVGQTLILSGLSQRERRTGQSGVPILGSIPILKYFFSQTTTAESNTAVVILLTPRDPGYFDAKQREEIAKFAEKRRAFIEARRGGAEGMRKFVERYPDWYQMAPNRFATHFFLMQTSELYRAVSGQDLATESLEFDLLGKRSE